MRIYLLSCTLFVCTIFSLSAQTDTTAWRSYFDERNLIQRKGMTVLGGWAAANLAVGAVGAWQSEGRTQAFHQMNLMWNSVNAGLAVAGYIRSKKPLVASHAAQGVDLTYRPEKTLIFNAGLDLAYMGAGAYLIERANTRTDLATRDQLQGFGTSLVVQGAFLFVFDLALHRALVKHRQKRLPALLNR